MWLSCHGIQLDALGRMRLDSSLQIEAVKDGNSHVADDFELYAACLLGSDSL